MYNLNYKLKHWANKYINIDFVSLKYNLLVLNYNVDNLPSTKKK